MVEEWQDTAHATGGWRGRFCDVLAWIRTARICVVWYRYYKTSLKGSKLKMPKMLSRGLNMTHLSIPQPFLAFSLRLSPSNERSELIWCVIVMTCRMLQLYGSMRCKTMINKPCGEIIRNIPLQSNEVARKRGDDIEYNFSILAIKTVPRPRKISDLKYEVWAQTEYWSLSAVLSLNHLPDFRGIVDATVAIHHKYRLGVWCRIGLHLIESPLMRSITKEMVADDTQAPDG